MTECTSAQDCVIHVGCEKFKKLWTSSLKPHTDITHSTPVDHNKRIGEFVRGDMSFKFSIS